MGLLGIVSIVATVLVVGAAGTGAYLYMTDYAVEATVQETDCPASEVRVQTKLFGIDHTVPDVPLQQCSVLGKGNFVTYHVKSKRTTLYESEGGACIYDSETGPFCGQATGGPSSMGLPV